MIVEYDADSTNESPCSIINFQLQDGGKNYRDYFVDISGGKHSIVIGYQESAKRMLQDLMPSGQQYAFKAAVYGFDFSDVRLVNVRWMKACFPGRSIRINRIAMLNEKKIDLEKIMLKIGDHLIDLVEKINADQIVYLSQSKDANFYDIRICDTHKCWINHSTQLGFSLFHDKMLSIKLNNFDSDFDVQLSIFGLGISLTY